MSIRTSLHNKFLIKDREYLKYRTAAFIELLSGSPANVFPEVLEDVDPLIPRPSIKEITLYNRLQDTEEQSGGKNIKGFKETKGTKGLGRLRTMYRNEVKELITGEKTGLIVESKLFQQVEIFNFLERLRDGFSSDANRKREKPYKLIRNYSAVYSKYIQNIDVNGPNIFYDSEALEGKDMSQPVSAAPYIVMEAKDALKITDIELFHKAFPEIFNDKEKLFIAISPIFTLTKYDNDVELKTIPAIEYVTQFLFSSLLLRPKIILLSEEEAKMKKKIEAEKKRLKEERRLREEAEDEGIEGEEKEDGDDDEEDVKVENEYDEDEDDDEYEDDDDEYEDEEDEEDY